MKTDEQIFNEAESSHEIYGNLDLDDNKEFGRGLLWILVLIFLVVGAIMYGLFWCGAVFKSLLEWK